MQMKNGWDPNPKEKSESRGSDFRSIGEKYAIALPRLRI